MHALFKTDVSYFKEDISEFACDRHDGPVNIYQWNWVLTDSTGEAYIVSTRSGQCTYGAETPLCPVTLCAGNVCDSCEGYGKPKEIPQVDVSVIEKEGFDLEVAQLDKEPEATEEKAEDNMYENVYGTNKAVMEGTFKTLEGFFGTKTMEDLSKDGE